MEEPYKIEVPERNASDEYLPLVTAETKGRVIIHDAAASGDIKLLKKCLDVRNKSPLEINRITTEVFLKDKTRRNRNILHLSAVFLGDPDTAQQCVQLICSYLTENVDQEQSYNLLNATDADGDTPLYLAAKSQNLEACKALLYAGSDMDIPNNRGKTPITKLFKKLPEMMADIFTQSGQRSHYIDGERTVINLYFRTLISMPTEADVRQRGAGLYREMDLLSNLSFTPLEQRTEILCDTHVSTLIWIKWQHYKFVFWLARIFQITWFLLYVAFLLTLYRVQCPFPGEKIYNYTWFATAPSSDSFSNIKSHSKLFSGRTCTTTSMKVIAWIVMFSAALDAVLIEGYPTVVRFRRKWYPMKTFTLKKYIKQIFRIVNILHFGKLVFLVTIFMNTIPVNFGIDILTTEWQYISAALGMFLAWYQIFLQLGKFPQFKGYIKMLTNTIYTLCIVGMLYTSLVFGFAMVFCILLPGVVTYSSPLEALMRISTFTIGEVDFEDTFYGEHAVPPASFVAAAIFFGMAIVILHIALLNFLIGLTINELKDVWEQAEVWRTYTYLWQIYLCETFISNFPFTCCQTFLMKTMVLKNKYLNIKDLQPGNHKIFYKTNAEKLPKHIREKIRGLRLSVIPEG